MKKIIDAIKSKDLQSKLLVLTLISMGIFSVAKEYLIQKASYKTTTEDPSSNQSVDTFIPKGFVLIPIEIANADSLNSIINGTGVVDLYAAPGGQGKKGILVGRRLKLIQAPLNNEKLAVMVKESESATILSFNGPFFAVIQNPAAVGQEVRTPEIHNKIQINYFN